MNFVLHIAAHFWSRPYFVCAILTLVSSNVQSAFAAENEQPKEITNSLGMKLLRIEPGTFTMGTSEKRPRSQDAFAERDYDEWPAHKVTITKPFYLGATEVTNAQFEAFRPAHKEFRGRGEISPGDNDPVVYVSHSQAIDFCEWLGAKEDRTYRLPSEAEWEYACRAGSTTTFSTGDTLSAEAANVGLAADGKTRQKTVAVGSYKPNAWGLFDMHGNVEEWCTDWYRPYSAEEQFDPVGRGDGFAMVTRGGSYNSRKMAPLTGGARYARSANRAGYLPDDANRAVGFRVVFGAWHSSKPLPEPELPLYQQGVKREAAAVAEIDPKKPFFDDFANRRSTIRENSWGPVFSAHNHYSTVAVCPNGDVLAAWYTTKSEAGHELAQAATRLRAGSDRWDEASSFLDIPDMNDHAPVLLTSGQRMYHFFGQGIRGWDDAAIAMRTSDDSGATWSRPRVIWSRDEKVQLSQPCSAVVLKDGKIVVAVDGDNHRFERLLISGDGGQTWQVSEGDMREACGGKYAIHPAMFDYPDGSLRIFLRGPNPMPSLLTRDLGRTYTLSETPLPGIGTGQKTAALRLASGAILLLSADSGRKLFGSTTFVALSRDGGQTWPHARKLDGVDGYMSLAQAPSGAIYAVGSRLGVAAFNEAWLAEGAPLK